MFLLVISNAVRDLEGSFSKVLRHAIDSECEETKKAPVGAFFVCYVVPAGRNGQAFNVNMKKICFCLMVG